jgi:hypothetical protein
MCLSITWPVLLLYCPSLALSLSVSVFVIRGCTCGWKKNKTSCLRFRYLRQAQAAIVGAFPPLYLRLPEDDALATKHIAVFKNLCTFCKLTKCTSRCIWLFLRIMQGTNNIKLLSFPCCLDILWCPNAVKPICGPRAALCHLLYACFSFIIRISLTILWRLKLTWILLKDTVLHCNCTLSAVRRPSG